MTSTLPLRAARRFASALLACCAFSVPLTASRAHAEDPPLPAPEFPSLCPSTAVGCNTQDVDYSYRAALFETIDLDSGWVPAGSPLQLRFAFYMGGFTQIDMGGTLVTAWPFPLSGQLVGRRATGLLTMDYGLEIIARMKIDLNIAGVRYRWEGDIPGTGSLTGDFRMMDTAMFDPFVLPGMLPRPISVSDTTDRATVFTYDAIGGFVPIPGISGGVRIDLQGELATSYKSDRIVVTGADTITEELGTTRILPDEGASDFGGSKDVILHPEGTLGYEGVLHVYPTFFVSLLGRSFDYDIADFALPLVDTGSNVVFDDDTAHVPLPAIEMLPSTWDLGELAIGATSEQYLDLVNDGEAPLVVRARMIALPFDVSTAPVVVPPRASTRLAVFFSPEMVATAAGTLFLETNDPDDPLMLVMLRGRGRAEAPIEVDAGVGDAGMPRVGPVADGGCSCRTAGGATGGGAPTGLALLAMSALVVVRRRRARRAVS